MLQFIQDNAGTLIVGAIVLAIVAAIIIKKVVDKKRGNSTGCGCGCNGCELSGDCSGDAHAPGN